METTQVAGFIYNVDLLKSYAVQLPVETVSLDLLRGAVGQGHTYWIDTEGHNLGPFQILQDWQHAQMQTAWQHHVDTIKRANLEDPIWIMRNDGAVFDGMHRLTRAFLDDASTIKVIFFEELPESAIIRSATVDD